MITEKEKQKRSNYLVNDSIAVLLGMAQENPKGKDAIWLQETFVKNMEGLKWIVKKDTEENVIGFVKDLDEEEKIVYPLVETIKAGFKYTFATDVEAETTYKPFFINNPEIEKWIYEKTYNRVTNKSELAKWIMINKTIELILQEGDNIWDFAEIKLYLQKHAQTFLSQTKSIPITESRLCEIIFEATSCIKTAPKNPLISVYMKLNPKCLSKNEAIDSIKRKGKYVLDQIWIKWHINENSMEVEKIVYIN